METSRMKRPLSFRAAALSVSGLACLGCVGQHAEEKASTPPSVVDTLTYIEVDLSRLNVINPSDLLEKLTNTDSSADPPVRATAVADLEDKIANLQCYDMDSSKPPKPDKRLRRRNPLVAVITGPMQVQVQGQFAYGSTWTLAVPPSVAGTETRQIQQQAMFPLTLVSLANLPAFYLGQQTTNIQYLTLYGSSNGWTATLPNGNTETKEVTYFLKNAMTVASALRDITNRALTKFDTNQDVYCSAKDDKAKTTIIPGAATPGP